MMKGLPSKERIIKDIEFEILLGTIPWENFGKAIFSIYSHQNKVRSEVIEAVRDPRIREALNKVFQLQEMQTVLLQEIGKVLDSIQSSLPQIVRFREEPAVPGESEGAFFVKGIDRESLWEQHSIVPQVEKFPEPGSLRVDLEVRPTRLPIIGKLINSAKIALHHLVLFYTNRLGAQQERINRMYSEQIWELTRMVVEQQEQISALVASVEDLRSRVQADKGS